MRQKYFGLICYKEIIKLLKRYGFMCLKKQFCNKIALSTILKLGKILPKQNNLEVRKFEKKRDA